LGKFLKAICYKPASTKGTSDGLIWTGSDLNKPRMGRLLPAQPTSGLSIGRTSATRAPPPPLPVSVAPQLTRGASTSSTTTALASTLSRASSLLGTPTRLSAMAVSHRSIPAAQDSSLNNNDQQTFSNNSELDTGAASSGENEGGGGGDQGGGSGGGSDGLNSDTGSSNSFSDAAADNSTRHYTSRKIVISSLTYHVSSASLLLRPTLLRLPPALALAISCGVDLLPGSACGFGARGAQSLLAAACVEGGGILLPTYDDSNNGGFGKAGGASSGGASSSAGGIATLKNALFASAAARAPYIHFAVAVSQPFMAIPAMCLSESHSNEKHNSFLSSLSSSSLPMSSPAWLVACCVEGTNGKWSKIPLPIAPQVFSQSIKAAAASFSSRAAATATEAEDEEIKVQPLFNSAPIVCQAAFASRTWSGASVILFFTGVLTPLNEKYSSYTGEGDKQIQQSQVTLETSTSKLLPQPCIWQVSLQIRSDDARVRAALAVDMPSLVHEWFCGRVSVISHGQEPSAESLLSRSDLFQPAQAKGANDAVSFAITAMQDRSASLHAKIAAEIPVIFNASSAASSTVSNSGSGGGGGGGGKSAAFIDEDDEEEEEEEEEEDKEMKVEQEKSELVTVKDESTTTQEVDKDIVQSGKEDDRG
jgi:hypothetical protein